jgi:hypothetical protein
VDERIGADVCGVSFRHRELSFRHNDLSGLVDLVDLVSIWGVKMEKL